MDNFISVNELAALKDCGKRKYDITKLSLHSKDFNKNMLNETCFKKVSELIAGRNFSTKLITDFVRESIDRAWYDIEIQYTAAVERTITLIERLGVYVSNYISNSNIIDVNRFYQTNFQASYKDVTFCGISGFVHMILDRGDYIEAILFESGVTPYSEKARKEENLPKNNLESAVVYSTLREMYPEKPIKVSFFYLKSKDDKGTTYSAYENKAGKNVISVNYTADISAADEIKRILAFNCQHDCDNCFNADVCKLNASIRVPEIALKDTTPSDVKPSPTQDEIIHHIDGPLLVEAVPGAGKTFTLVHRLAYLIEIGIKPENVLMITFTNKAANEIKTRVAELVGEVNMPNIETFNSFGYNLLRANFELLGGNVKLASPVDKKGMVMQALKECAADGILINNVNYSQLIGKYGLVETVFKWFEKIEQIGFAVFAESYASKDIENIYKVYERYSSIFTDNGYIDYDDQIELVNKLFAEHQKINCIYHNIYKYVMVDEFQDTNESQFSMIYSLVGSNGNIVAVGDVDQGIYGFRGGNSKYALEFDCYFNNPKIVMMIDNYRCTAPIINSANTLICHNENRYDKKIVAHKDGGPVLLYEELDAEQLTLLVSNLKSKYKSGEIAVITRKNSLLKRFGEWVGLKNTSSKDYIVDDTVYLGLLDVMDLFYNGLDFDDVVLYRALQYAGAGDTIIRKNNKKSLYDDLVTQGLIPDLNKFTDLMVNGDKLHDAAVRIADCFQILSCAKDTLEDDEMVTVINSLTAALYCMAGHPVADALANMAYERDIKNIRTMYGLMKRMSIFGDTARVGYPVDSGHINLLTAHDSKGKEFKCVILYGIDEFEPDEEERRLLYVALTRAKETLIIVKNAESRNMLPEFRDTVKRLVIPRKDVANG